MSKRRSEDSPAPGAPAFMNTYGDMVTLLLTFFVLLLSFSSIDEDAFRALIESFGYTTTFSIVQTGGRNRVMDLMGNGIMDMPTLAQRRDAEVEQRTPQPEVQRELSQMASDFMTYFAENNLADNVRVEVHEFYVLLDLGNHILFDSGRAVLRPEAYEVLDIIGQQLTTTYLANEIEITGHTDNVPISTPQFPSNWQLSTARAHAVGSYLMYESGVSPMRLTIIGRGEYHPIVPNDSPENLATNRRVEIRIRTSQN